MPAAKKPAAASKAAAARAENGAGPKGFAWRDIEFVLPASLPATVAFDIADLEGDAGVTELFRFVSGIIGADQLAKIREKIAQDGDRLDDLGDILNELLELVLGPYGMSLGESAASPAS